MRYIYYIIAIVVILTIATAFQLTSIKIEVAEPAIVVNDRIISEKELDSMLANKTDSFHTASSLDSIITNELLIQEAVKQGINKEEDFRQSVENFYEQSLIRVLIDRQLASLKPEISQDLIDRYRFLSAREIVYEQEVFSTLEGEKGGEALSKDEKSAPFEYLSDSLKFAFLQLDKGDTTTPEPSEGVYVAYRLIETRPLDIEAETDTTSIRDFLMNQKKQALFDTWLNNLKTSADISILTKRKI